MENDEKTIKVPLIVHLLLKRLSAEYGLPIYGVIARLLLDDIYKHRNNA